MLKVRHARQYRRACGSHTWKLPLLCLPDMALIPMLVTHAACALYTYEGAQALDG